jgi:LacI family transcriptional regulator
MVLHNPVLRSSNAPEVRGACSADGIPSDGVGIPNTMISIERQTMDSAPTLADVAEAAGISLKTASRVLNGEASVSKKTRDRVQRAMATLGYRPNQLARGLKARKSAAIGMVVPNFSDPFTATAIQAVQQVARSKGYVVIVASSGGDEELERSELESLISRQVDGLIIAPADGRTNTIKDTLPSHLPVVTFDQVVRGSDYGSVTVDNRHSAQMATEHLISHGLRRIAAIGARPQLYTCAERVTGYRRAMLRSSLEPRVCLLEHESMLSARWLSEHVFGTSRVEAIFSLNWVCTMLILRALHRLGRKIGPELPFLAFDEFDLAETIAPGITVVQQPTELIGKTAATLLFERIKGNHSDPRNVMLRTQLVIRGSCGCNVANYSGDDQADLAASPAHATPA